VIRTVAVVGSLWMGAGFVVAVLFGRAARRGDVVPPVERHAPQIVPLPTQPEVREAHQPTAEETAVALHAIRTTTGLVADTAEAFLDCWAAMSEAQRSEVIRTIATHTRLVEHLADDVLQAVPDTTRASLDSLADERDLPMQHLTLVRASVGARPAGETGDRASSSSGTSSVMCTPPADDDAAAISDGAVPAVREAVFEPTRPHRRKRVAAVAAAGATALLLPATGAAAATGDLPRPAQRLVAAAAHVVGIEIPRAPTRFVPDAVEAPQPGRAVTPVLEPEAAPQVVTNDTSPSTAPATATATTSGPGAPSIDDPGEGPDAAKAAGKDAAEDAPKNAGKEGPKNAGKDAAEEAPKDERKDAPKNAGKDAAEEAPKNAGKASGKGSGPR
jgi:hypothetical protein